MERGIVQVGVMQLLPQLLQPCFLHMKMAKQHWALINIPAQSLCVHDTTTVSTTMPWQGAANAALVKRVPAWAMGRPVAHNAYLTAVISACELSTRKQLGCHLRPSSVGVSRPAVGVLLRPAACRIAYASTAVRSIRRMVLYTSIVSERTIAKQIGWPAGMRAEMNI